MFSPVFVVIYFHSPLANGMKGAITGRLFKWFGRSASVRRRKYFTVSFSSRRPFFLIFFLFFLMTAKCSSRNMSVSPRCGVGTLSPFRNVGLLLSVVVPLFLLLHHHQPLLLRLFSSLSSSSSFSSQSKKKNNNIRCRSQVNAFLCVGGSSFRVRFVLAALRSQLKKIHSNKPRKKNKHNGY